MDLLVLDRNTSQIKINSAFLTFPPFSKLVKVRINNGILERELKYMFLVLNYNSFLRSEGYTGNKLKTEARKESGLPTDWKPDSYFTDAMNAYDNHLQGKLQRKLIDELINASNKNLSVARNANRLLEHAQNTLSDLLDKPELSNDDFLEAQNIMKSAISSSEAINKIVEKIPANIESLQDYYTRIEEEQSSHDAAMGGYDVDNSMLPQESGIQ